MIIVSWSSQSRSVQSSAKRLRDRSKTETSEVTPLGTPIGYGETYETIQGAYMRHCHNAFKFRLGR
eukprot:UN17779